MKKHILLALVPFAFACSHAPRHEEAGRDVASKRSRPNRPAPQESCESAFRKASSSASTGDVVAATEVCETAKQALCIAMTEGMGGTGDGRYVGAHCGLTGDYGGNKAVNDGKATPNCEEAFQKAKDSASTGDLMEAAEVCAKSTTETCAKGVEMDNGRPTGDSRLVAANCALKAAYGGVLEIRGPKKVCKALNACVAKCPKKSAHPGMCPATCKADIDPTNLCK